MLFLVDLLLDLAVPSEGMISILYMSPLLFLAGAMLRVNMVQLLGG